MHSEEEIAGSYNWDYLLDWGPHYQPLAHVFKEVDAFQAAEHALCGFRNIIINQMSAIQI